MPDNLTVKEKTMRKKFLLLVSVLSVLSVTLCASAQAKENDDNAGNANVPWVVLIIAPFGAGLVGAVLGFVGTIFVSNKQIRANAIRERRSELNGLYASILKAGNDAQDNFYPPEKEEAVNDYLRLRSIDTPESRQRLAQLENEHPDLPLLAAEYLRIKIEFLKNMAYVDLIVDDEEVKTLYYTYQKDVFLNIGKIGRDEYFPKAEQMSDMLVAAMKKSTTKDSMKRWYKQNIP